MKQVFISLLLGVEALAFSPRKDVQPYLWENREEAVERLCFTRKFTLPEGYTKRISGSCTVTGERRLSFPGYSCSNAAIDSPEAAVTSLLDVMESWAEQTFYDQAFCDEFQLLTYRSIFPAGCFFMCLRPGHYPSASFDRGEVCWGSRIQVKKDCVAEILTQFGSEQDWPLLREATASWLRHPRLDEQEVNVMLDRVLEDRAERIARDPTLKKYPDSWAEDPSMALLEYLESRGLVVLSLSKMTTGTLIEGPLHRFEALIGCRTQHTEEQAFRLCCECIEYLQNQLPPLEETLAHPPQLKLSRYKRWLGAERIPISLVINFPSNATWSEDYLMSAWIDALGIRIIRMPPLSSLTSPGAWIRVFGNIEPGDIPEVFPKTRALHQVFLELCRQEEARARPLRTVPLTPEELP